MNTLKRRVLFLVLIVMCLFGLTILGASAAGSTEKLDTSVASVTIDDATYYYDDLASVIADAPDGSTITLLKDVTLTAATDISGSALMSAVLSGARMWRSSGSIPKMWNCRCRCISAKM